MDSDDGTVAVALIDPQPTRGSWVKSAGYGGTFRPQPTRGSWVKSAGYRAWKLKGWHVGRVVF